MEDLFLKYQISLEDYLRQKGLYEGYKVNLSGLIDYLYDSMTETKPGNDAICLEHMKYDEYNKMVSKNFSNIAKEKMHELEKLESNFKKAYCSLIEIASYITKLGRVSFLELIQILTCFEIPFEIKNINDKTIIAMFFGDTDAFYIAGETINLVAFENDKLIINAPNTLTDFIEFLVDFRNENSTSISIPEIFKLYQSENKKLV